MNKKVEELMRRVRLTPLEISEVLIRQVKDDGKYIERRQYEYLLDDQLKKVLNDPDIAIKSEDK